MVRVHWYPALLQENPRYQPTVDPRSVGLVQSARQNLATSLGIPLNNVTLRSRYFSPREVQAIAPTVIKRPMRAYRYIRKPVAMKKGGGYADAWRSGSMPAGYLVLDGDY